MILWKSNILTSVFNANSKGCVLHLMDLSKSPVASAPCSVPDKPSCDTHKKDMEKEKESSESETGSPQQSAVPDSDPPKEVAAESKSSSPGENANSADDVEKSPQNASDKPVVEDGPEKCKDDATLNETGKSVASSKASSNNVERGTSIKTSAVSNSYMRGASMYRKTLKPKKERSPSPEIDAASKNPTFDTGTRRGAPMFRKTLKPKKERSPSPEIDAAVKYPFLENFTTKTEPVSPPPEERVAQEPSAEQADPPQPSQTVEKKPRQRGPRKRLSIMGNKVLPKAEGKLTQTETSHLLGFGQLKTEPVDNGEPASTTESNVGETGTQTSSGEDAVVKEEPKVRTRRAEAIKADAMNSTINSSESMQISDEEDDAMVDDPNDEDFIPFGFRKPKTRLSLRAQAAQQRNNARPPPPPLPPPTLTKMTCANCRAALQKGQTAYQRKGLPQLFCSSSCLTAFSRKPLCKKTCTFCKKEILSSKDSVVAQTGDGGSFQEFCTSACLSLFEAQPVRPTPPPQRPSDTGDIIKCSICHKPGEIQHEVSNGNVVHRLCSDSCFTKFRATKGLKTNCCDNCGIYIYNKGLPLEYLFHEGQQKRFCNSTCLNGYKKKNTKVFPCMWCKTLCKNFDMLSNVDKNNRMGLFCSVCCITSHKVKQSGLTGPARPCSLCRRSLSEPVYYNKTDRVVYQFCSPSCWTKFQRTTPEGGIHLTCHYCNNLFTGKPEILDWQNNVYQFCCKDCCDDYKRLRGVVSQCEYCKQEKLLHEKIRFSGVEKNFCSEGCVLLYKQDFTKNLGLCCITCTYCSQTCQRAVTEELDGSTWDFCSEDCKSKYLLWYFKAARCNACKRQGKLLETIHWRGEIRHFCNQQCLLRFYNQQNQPNLDTQKGPESLLNSQSPDAKSPTATTPSKPETNTNSVKPRPAQPTTPPPPTPVAPTPRKNKAAMCKPLMTNRGVTCKVESRAKHCQTEDDWKPQVIVLPIPVPIFVPVPMHMYCQKVPVPVSVPVPVPVPMFLPTTLENTDKIVEAIEELKGKIPSNPLEADILAMAEMIAEAEELDKASSDLCDLASDQSGEGLLEDCDLFGPARDDVLAMAVKMANVLEEPGRDLEADFPKNSLDINQSVDFLFDCGIVPPDEVPAEQEAPKAHRKGQKRLALTESSTRDTVSSQPASSPPASSQPASQPASSQPASSPPASSQPASQPASSQPASQPASQTNSQPASQTNSQPASQTNSQPASQTNSQPASQTNSQPASQTNSQPASQTNSQPASQTNSQPASQTNSQPASQTNSQPASQPNSQTNNQPNNTGLSHSYGVNAWRTWVQAKYANGEPSKVDDPRFGSKPIRIKDDLLTCTATELNYGLVHFVKEVTRPNGERYEPDSIFYLLLGIQQYLLDSNRMVNIFTDHFYLSFVQELNKLLATWHANAPTRSLLFSRVEEEHLWDCKQLGVYSPFVLLNTLMFFNTKYFGLRTPEEHMQLSFTNVVCQSRKCSTSRGTIKLLSVRYYPPARQRKGRESGSKRKRDDEIPILEQRENRMNPLRCPVKFYEFYLSKCPEALKNRSDVFYQQPERSCVAESPLWYSVLPMEKAMLENMLNRILAVREIYEEHHRAGILDDDMD
ncbi:zinc finger MYM-type protein 3 isoform X2 [Pleurodeles waltl]|uniref:zinc finger MYM-type protein 3 isoform X2 n=1 Tax=Pleurodeles waltl TaxID=8319 RepID=UPI003709541B